MILFLAGSSVIPLWICVNCRVLLHNHYSQVVFDLDNRLFITSLFRSLSKFRRRSLLIFIIKGFVTIVLIFIVISTTFRSICPPTFFRYLSNSGNFTELRTTSFIETTGVARSDSVSHNWVQVLRIPVFLLACSEDWTCNLQMIVSLEA